MSYSLNKTLTYLEAKYSFIFSNCSGKLRCKPTSLKEYLSNHAYINSVGNKLIVEPTLEDVKKFKNSLFLDFEHYYIKTMVQYTDYLTQVNVSKTWSIVTFYYLLFFLITTLCKYVGHSCIYLSAEDFNEISKNIITQYDPKFFGKGIYVYLVEKKDDQLTITLHKDTSGMGIHEKSWDMFHKLLQQIYSNMSGTETETLIIQQIITCMNKYKPNFPSKIRNKVNYQGHYALEEIQNNIPYLIHNDLNKIFTLHPRASDDYATQTESLIYIGIFLFKLVQELHSDVNLRLNTTYNEFDEIQREFCIRRNCNIETFNNLFK